MGTVQGDVMERALQRGIDEASELTAKIRQEVAKAFVGSLRVMDLTLSCLLARGHLLIEDVPGVGKTTLAMALAKAIGGGFRRIQFTSDLMPSDVIGVSVYDQGQGSFRFLNGPVFTNVLLADEINRASPRTQSALLEAMSEGQVTVDNETHHLPRPFFVVATQNPHEHFGTYPLPDSQMDRFALRLDLGYPTKEDELRIILGEQAADNLDRLEAVAATDAVIEAQRQVGSVHVDDSLTGYLLDIVDRTRHHPDILLGVSPRGARIWFQIARAHALVQGRSFCVPDDFKTTAQPVLAHRLIVGLENAGGRSSGAAQAVLHRILEETPVPG